MDPEASTAISKQLEEDIRLGRLVRGAVLHQEVLASRFGVSRQPIRLAIQSLRTAGLVALRQDRSVEVTGPSREELCELVTIRLILECEALRIALPQSTEQNVLEATHLQERQEIEEDPRRLETLDNAFHNALYRPCKNARLLRLISELRSEDRRPYREQEVGSAKRALWSKQHRRLLRHYTAGDCGGALRALEQHLSALKEREDANGP
jgi:DNA-binding GntR family transcriptional regulator